MKWFQLAIISLIALVLFSCDKSENHIADDMYNTWEVIDFMSIESVSYAKNSDVPILITFEQNEIYQLNLDVNSCSGSFVLADDGNIEISVPGCTKMCCDSDFSNKVTTMLPQVTSYTIEGNMLKLNVPQWGWINLELHN